MEKPEINMSTDDINMQKYFLSCRICLLHGESALTPLFTTFVDTKSYSEMYYECTGIDKKPDKYQDFYPQNICHDCENELLQAYKFKKKSLESNNKLSQYFKNFVTIKNEMNIGTTIKTEFENINTEASNEENVSYTNNLPENQTDSKYEYDCDSCNSSCKLKIKGKKKINQEDEEKSRQRGLCPICGKTMNRNTIIRHINNHKVKRNDLETYSCDECSKIYKYKSSLYMHMRLHRNEKRYECGYCHKRFFNSSDKNKHVDAIHTKIKKFGCHLCEERYHSNARLQDHIRRHTGELAYECDVCKKRFPTRKRVNLHKAMHSTERNFKCEFCGKGFGTSKTLRLHIKTHTGERNYICPVCSRAFIQNHIMKIHIRKNHPGFPIPPPGTIVSIKVKPPANETIDEAEPNKPNALDS